MPRPRRSCFGGVARVPPRAVSGAQCAALAPAGVIRAYHVDAREGTLNEAARTPFDEPAFIITRLRPPLDSV